MDGGASPPKQDGRLTDQIGRLGDDAGVKGADAFVDGMKAKLGGAALLDHGAEKDAVDLDNARCEHGGLHVPANVMRHCW